MESYILFYEKCRLCLDLNGICNIFEKDEFPNDIYLCTGVKVHPSDNLPQKICAICQKIVQNAKELRLTATKNNIHLRSLLSSEDMNDTSSQQSEDSNCSSTGETKTNEKGKSKKTHIQEKHMLSVRKDLFETLSTETSPPQKKKHTYYKILNRKRRLGNSIIYEECEICFKTFDNAKKLYLHMRNHNKTVECPLDTCSSKFATKSDMEKHFRTHTGEKPYRCKHCDKGFTQKCTLNAHVAAIHED